MYPAAFYMFLLALQRYVPNQEVGLRTSAAWLSLMRLKPQDVHLLGIHKTQSFHLPQHFEIHFYLIS